jgi:hypothetical protein
VWGGNIRQCLCINVCDVFLLVYATLVVCLSVRLPVVCLQSRLHVIRCISFSQCSSISVQSPSYSVSGAPGIRIGEPQGRGHIRQKVQTADTTHIDAL